MVDMPAEDLVEPVDEKPDQVGNGLFALPQRRQMEVEDIDAVEQVLPEFFLLDQ